MELISTGIAGTLESGDILIEITKQDKGGIVIDLDSTVESQFGRHIRAAIEKTMQELGIRNATVRAVDKGALDCTVRARTTAAVYRGCQCDQFVFE